MEFYDNIRAPVNKNNTLVASYLTASMDLTLYRFRGYSTLAAWRIIV